MSNLDDSNVFGTRRSCGVLTLLSQAPITSQSAGAVNLPHVAPVHNSYPYTRELYSNYPAEVACKIKTDQPDSPNTVASTANSGLLTLKVESEILAARCSFRQASLIDYETPLVVLFYTEEMVFRSDYWDGGDDKQYDSVTFFWNVPTGDPPPDPAWLTYETTVSRTVDGTQGFVTSSTNYLSGAPNTTGAPSLFNGGTSPSGETFNGTQVYALFNGAQDYTDLLVGGDIITQVSNFKVRHDSQTDEQGLKAFVTNPSVPFDSPGWANSAASTAPTNAFPIIAWSEIPYTYTPDDSTWIGTLLAVSVKAECKFSYTSPTSCDRLWWPGAKVKLKVTYKKAEIIRTLGIGSGTYSSNEGYSVTLGSWASAGDEEIEVTLPEYSATPQDIGDPWDLEEIPGYVVAIDDIQILEVT